jgi:hypothetical protein
VDQDARVAPARDREARVELEGIEFRAPRRLVDEERGCTRERET